MSANLLYAFVRKFLTDCRWVGCGGERGDGLGMWVGRGWEMKFIWLGVWPESTWSLGVILCDVFVAFYWALYELVMWWQVMSCITYYLTVSASTDPEMLPDRSMRLLQDTKLMWCVMSFSSWSLLSFWKVNNRIAFKIFARVTCSFMLWKKNSLSIIKHLLNEQKFNALFISDININLILKFHI